MESPVVKKVVRHHQTMRSQLMARLVEVALLSLPCKGPCLLCLPTRLLQIEGRDVLGVKHVSSIAHTLPRRDELAAEAAVRHPGAYAQHGQRGAIEVCAAPPQAEEPAVKKVEPVVKKVVVAPAPPPPVKVKKQQIIEVPVPVVERVPVPVRIHHRVSLTDPGDITVAQLPPSMYAAEACAIPHIALKQPVEHRRHCCCHHRMTPAAYARPSNC